MKDLNEINFASKNDIEIAKTTISGKLIKKNLIDDIDLYHIHKNIEDLLFPEVPSFYGTDSFLLSKNGKHIGHMIINLKRNPPKIGLTALYKKYRGKGIAKALYKFIFNKYGKLRSDSTLTRKGTFDLWTKFMPTIGHVYLILPSINWEGIHFGKIKVDINDVDLEKVDWTYNVDHFEIYKTKQKSEKNKDKISLIYK